MKKDPRSGVALILVMVSIAFMAIIIVEVIAASRVDLRIAINGRNRLQAQYLAQSSAKLQLLRMYMYKEVANLKAGNSGIPIDDSMIDKIWNVPMPPIPLPGVKSTWPGELSGTISTEGSKIPINLLDASKYRGSSPEIRDAVKKQIETLIAGLLETEEFDEKYRGLEPKDLVNPLVDWIDSDKDLVEGGDEDREYERLDPPYKTRSDRMPSLSEINMVQGWTDDLIRRIAGNFSVLNVDTKVNPNYVALSRIKTWGPNLTDAELAYIDQHRRLKPLSSMGDLETLVSTDPEIRGGEPFTIPEELKEAKALSKRERVFRIEATGIVAGVRRNIRLGVILLDEAAPQKPNNTNPDPDDGTPQEKAAKLLDPQVVFVEEYL